MHLHLLLSCFPPSPSQLLMRWFKLTVETFESTTNPPNGSLVVMTRKEGPAGGRSGGGVYEMAPESAALISLRQVGRGGRKGGREGVEGAAGPLCEMISPVGRIPLLCTDHPLPCSIGLTSSLI